MKFEAPLIMNENVFENKFSKRNPEDRKMMLIKSCQLIGYILVKSEFSLMKVTFESLNMFCAPMIFILYIVLNILQGSVRQRNQDPGH